MKKNLKYSFLAIAFALISCDDLTDLNVNPSFPVEVQSISLMPNVQQQMAQGIQFDTRFAGRYTQYFSAITAGDVWDLQGYAANSDASGEIWRAVYFGIGLNLVKLQETAIAENRHDIVGFSKAVQAWSWQTATDYHGELIAFNQVFTPRLTYDYSSQQQAYSEVIRLVDESIVDLSRTDGLVSQAYFSRGDLIYGGDRTKWIKFANGVKARNLNSQINKVSYNPDAVIAACDASLASPADDAVNRFNGTVSGDSNFFGPTRTNFTAFRQSDFLVRTMNGAVFTGVIDPRLSRVCVPSVGASETLPATAANPNIALYTYNGNPLNTTAATTGTNRIPNFWGTFLAGTSTNPGRYLFRDKCDFPLMTYAEIQFIKAEAAFIKGDKVTARTAYINGINASFDIVNRYTIPSTIFPVTSLITAAERSTYLANTAIVPATAGALTLSQIMIQKYIALFGFGTMETWVDMRKYRYNPAVYTSLVNPTGSGLFIDNGGKLPYRVRPRFNSEFVWNFQALQAIGGTNPDYHTREMWFMQP